MAKVELTPQLLAQNRRLGGIHPVKLKNMLRRIHSNSDDLVHERSPLSEISNDLILAQAMPSGAVHTIRRRHLWREIVVLCWLRDHR